MGVNGCVCECDVQSYTSIYNTEAGGSKKQSSRKSPRRSRCPPRAPCSLHKRPDEVEEERGKHVSKDSESLLVARPDGQHKGSNDPEDARSGMGRDPNIQPRGATASPVLLWAIINALADQVVDLREKVAENAYKIRRLRSSTSQGKWR